MNRIRRLTMSCLCCAVMLWVSGRPAGAMELTVLMPGGQTLKLVAQPDETVDQLKKAIYSISNISPYNQTMYRGDSELSGPKSLASYGIGDGDTLQVRHDIHPVPTSKEHTGTIWIVLGFVLIVGTGVFFMRKKPAKDDVSR
jgi:hypothetical protein